MQTALKKGMQRALSYGETIDAPGTCAGFDNPRAVLARAQRRRESLMRKLRSGRHRTGIGVLAGITALSMFAAVGAPATAEEGRDSGEFMVDNATGLASDGEPMAGPGLDNRDIDGYYYSIGAAQIDSSAGGDSLYLYKGEDWRDKELVGKVAGPEMTYTMPDGTVTHPLANAKLERVDFERSPSGKYVIWAHWELKATYNASQVIVFAADRPEGPYEIVSPHARPGASLNVGGIGEAGTTDFAEAMGDRVGQLRADFDTQNADGTYDGSPMVPVHGRDYPPQISTFPKPNGPKSGGYDPDKPGSRIEDGLYGTSVQEGTWWIYNFNDLRDDMTLKATAVRMTPYDSSAYEAAKAAGLNPSAGSYIVRYPAAKSDRNKAAGVSAEGYEGKLGQASANDGIALPTDEVPGGEEPGGGGDSFTACGVDGLAFSVSYQEGDSGKYVCDGDTSDASRWSTWNTADASATFAYDAGYVTVDKAHVVFSEQAPSRVVVTGRTASGSWAELGALNVDKKVGAYDVELDENQSVDRLRVTMQGQWMKANEITFSGVSEIGAASIEGITFGDSKVRGFSSSTFDYSVAVGDLDAIGEVAALNAKGVVAVEQPTADNGYVATVTVATSADDPAVSKTYTVTFTQRAGNGGGAYDPNVDDRTIPLVDDIDQSAVVAEQYNAVADDSGQRQGLTVPEIAPRLDENQGVNSESASVVANNGDRVYVTADINLQKNKVLVTTDGSDPRTSDTAWQWDNRYHVPDVKITDGLVVKAVSANFNETEFSEVAQTSFTLAEEGTQASADVPVFDPVMTFKSGDYAVPEGGGMFGYAELRILSPTYNAEVYYTMDGADPEPARYGQNIGFGSRDYAMFVDEEKFGGDGKPYFITGQDHIYMRVWGMNDDMTAVDPVKQYDINVAESREAPQAIRSPGGEYVYLLTSGQSGWYKNQAMYQRTKDISSGFGADRDDRGYRNGEAEWTKLQPFADNTTYNSQVGGVWNLGTKDDPVYLFNGSRWALFDLGADLADSTTVWFPMTIDDDADGPGAATGEEIVIGKDREGTEVKAATYAPEPGLLKVDYAQKVRIDLEAGTVEPGDGTDEVVKIATDQANLGDTDPGNHTPRVIDYQDPGTFYECDKFDPAGLAGETEWVTCPGGPLEQQGIIRGYGVDHAFNGIKTDVDNYDGTESIYKGRNEKFFITLDLGQQRDLTSIAMSFKAVSGSDNAHRYSVYGSNDNKKWTRLVNNTGNNVPGFMGHDLTGNTYRYVKFQNTQSYDMVHGRGAEWARGLYELEISAKKLIPLDVGALRSGVDQGTLLSQMTDIFTGSSLATLTKALEPARELLATLEREGEETKHTQDEVDSIAGAVIDAMKNLQTVGSGITIDVRALADAIVQGESKLEDAASYTSESVEALRAAINEGKTVLEAAEDPDTTQDQVNAAVSAIEDAIAGLEPFLDVTAEVSTRCLAGKVFVAVRATNGGDRAVDITLATPYGEKRVSQVASGENAYQSFASRAVSIPVGVATVTSVATVGDEQVSVVHELEVPATSCQ